MPRHHLSRRERFNVLTRCNYACFYCGTPAALGLVTLQVEHVVPVAQGGTNDPWNLVAACPDCNAGKSADAPHPDTIAAAARLYTAWSGRSHAVLTCSSCRRPWIADPDEDEPNSECWSCIRAWCDGHEYASTKGEAK